MMAWRVIIPSANANNLSRCVDAIYRAEPGVSADRIIVVDDGARRQTRDDGRRLCVTWVPGQKPFVFARNVNIGIRAAGRDDVIVMNDDALLVTPGGFSLLAEVAHQHPDLGVVAACTNNAGNPNQFPRGIGLRIEDRMVCFICVYIPRRTIDAIGLLDERYTGYGLDDDDYCLRVRLGGLKLAIHDGCFVDHKSLLSTYRGASNRGGDMRENMQKFVAKWGFDNWGRPAGA